MLAHLDVAGTRATKRNHHLQAALPVTEQAPSAFCTHLFRVRAGVGQVRVQHVTIVVIALPAVQSQERQWGVACAFGVTVETIETGGQVRLWEQMSGVMTERVALCREAC